MKKPLRQQWYDTILFLMKITVAQIFLAFLFGSLTYATDLTGQGILDEKVTLHIENAELKKVLLEIERITEARFAYSSKIIRVRQKISIDADGKKLADLLNDLLAPLDVSYAVIAGRISLFKTPPTTSSVISEPSDDITSEIVVHTLSGKITDEAGQPLPGVNIIEKGTTNGTTTDATGTYKMEVSTGNATVIFSFIGYVTQEVAVNNQSVINISLNPDILTLQEIVVVGYGTQEKKVVTGAVSTVTSKDITQTSVTGFDQAMQGRMAGVQVTQNSGTPGGGVSVRIRGVGSISGASEPLYVVDGVPMLQTLGALNSINPNDIERIDVLKDAASAAIYGSRATNGVVLVTTKRGKAGKVTVNFDSYVGVQNAYKKIDLLDGPQFAKLANENLVAGGQPANPTWGTSNTDWQDAVFRAAPIQSHNISVGGGGERSRNLFSAGYFKQDGILIASDYTRYNARLNSDYDIGKKFKVGTNISFSHDKQNSGDVKNSLVNATQLQPVNPVYTDKLGSHDGSFYGWKGYELISGAASALYYPANLNNQVAIDEAYVSRPLTTDQLMLSGFGEYEILKGLRFRTAMNYVNNTSLYIFDRPGVPTEINARGTFVNPSVYAETWGAFSQWNWVNTVSYDREIGKHNFSLVVGTDALENTQRQVYVNGSGNPPGQLSINALASKNTTGFSEVNSLVSYLGRFNYDYADKYLVSFSLRRDGSSKFIGDNLYGNFPALSVGWRISEEPFLQSVKQINELKLRASYGVVGNQNIPSFQYANAYASNSGRSLYPLGTGQNLTPAFYQSVVGNSRIHWEESTTTDVGIDATLFDGMLTLTADYYIKEITDLLGNAPVPASLAVLGNTITKNTFSMENKGFEIALGFNKELGKVNFSANANFSTLDNKVTKLLENSATDYVSKDGAFGFQSRSQVGERIGNFYGYVTDGIIQNGGEAASSGMGGVAAGDRRFKDLNGDGVINARDRTVIGNGLPKYLYGLNLKAELNRFDFSVFLQGQAGVDIANMVKAKTHRMDQSGMVNGSTDLLNSWSGEGSTNELTRNAYNAPPSNMWFSSFYVENGAFMRIKNVQLGYTLPTDLLTRVGLTRVRFYVSAQNLFTFTKYSGWDPEIGSQPRVGAGDGTPVSFESDPALTGVDYGRYPLPRVFMGGLNIQF